MHFSNKLQAFNFEIKYIFSTKLQASTHISFLHDELIRLPSFPRKALDAEFMLYNIPKQGKVSIATNSIHFISILYRS